jgi:putative aldouronate transport system permease protein
MQTEFNWMQARKKFKQNLFLLLLFFPPVLYFIVIKYTPMLGLIIAFKDYSFVDGVLGSPWVGLSNFETLFNTSQTLQIIRNTLMLSLLSVFVGFPFPIFLAILLSEASKIWFRKSVQTLVFLPHFISWVVIGGMVLSIFSQEAGVVNYWIKQWTGNAVPFLYKEIPWITIFVGSGIWKTAGWTAIIYMAALTTIDPSLYESASLDGAGKLRKIWHITLPGISSTIVLMFILSMGHVMEVGFDQVYVLQNPVISNVSEVISTYIYKVGLQGMQFSLTAAMGLFESLISLIMVLSANQIARKFGRGLW